MSELTSVVLLNFNNFKTSERKLARGVTTVAALLVYKSVGAAGKRGRLRTAGSNANGLTIRAQ